MLEDRNVRKAGIAVLGILALFLLVKTIGEVQQLKYIGTYPSSPSQISVAGKGEVVAEPDIATFSFSVTKESKAVEEAQEASAKAVSAILAYLKEQGIAEKDIQTTGYTIYPRYEYPDARSSIYPPYGRQTLAAYVVTQSITVKVRELAKAGELLSGAGSRGATEVSGLSFDFDKRDAMVKEARDKAIAEAREEADKLANALGVRLVRIVSYSDNGNYIPLYKRAYAVEMQASNGSADASASLPAGEQRIVSNVTIVYEVK